MTRIIAIGTDHAAVSTKAEIISMIEAMHGFSVVDCGPMDTSRVDYPDFAEKVCRKVQTGEAEKGILICGSGIGMSIAANKMNGIRAALCHDHYTARMCREHNDANVVCAGARSSGIEIIKEIVEVFLTTDFTGGNHTARLEKVAKLLVLVDAPDKYIRKIQKFILK